MFTELETNSNKKNTRGFHRGISDVKKSYRHRNNIEKDEKGDLVRDANDTVYISRKCFSQFFNVQAVSGVWQN
jgi:hypothetical protein